MMNPRHKSTLASNRFVPIAVAVIFLLGVAGAAIRFLHGERERVMPLPVLMFHGIGESASNVWWLAGADFEAQLRGLHAAGYRTITPDDLRAHQAWGKPLPRKPVLITFDDGYLACLTAAEPVLQALGFRATCFLITGKVGPAPDTRQSFEGHLLLTWPEIRAMQKRGTISFGGHTRNHASLLTVANPREEIQGSFDDIREQTGFRPLAFCYPYGQCSPATAEQVQQAGYRMAFVCQDALAHTGPSLDMLQIPRVSVFGGSRAFGVQRLPAATPDLTLRIADSSGIIQHVVPRLVWNTQAETEGWGKPFALSPAGWTLTWRLPKPAWTSAPPTFELWDQHRLLRLFKAAVPPVAPPPAAAGVSSSPPPANPDKPASDSSATTAVPLP